jgi:hypothetical protein
LIQCLKWLSSINILTKKQRSVELIPGSLSEVPIDILIQITVIHLTFLSLDFKISDSFSLFLWYLGKFEIPSSFGFVSLIWIPWVHHNSFNFVAAICWASTWWMIRFWKSSAC